MSIQPGGRPPILGEQRELQNPLLILAEALERQTQVLAQIAENTRKPGEHVYALHEVGPGQFLTYCLACSEAQNRPVHPCEDAALAPKQTPPGTFVVSEPTSPPTLDILSGD